ncbi:MAG: hypothetical protein E6J74_41105 [Deltaproteobacteria bacterium]|nr:MAG: hypothetical protein E6J74_41105 [Deltaproteobacteria bacterium]
MENSDAQLENQEPDIFDMATVSSPDAVKEIPRNLRGLPAGVFRVLPEDETFLLAHGGFATFTTTTAP